MVDKGTIIDGDQSLNPDEIDRLEKAYKAGRREVVEWIMGNATVEPNWGRTLVFTVEWQAQLKEWFKDNPGLLKEWGIE